MTPALSPSASVLASIIARSTAAHVARSLECDESAVRSWANGKRRPTKAWRARLAAFDARLAVDGWGDAARAPEAIEVPSPAGPTTDSPQPQPPPRPRRPPHVPSVASGGEERLLEVILQCDELFEEASDPDAHASVRDRTAILAAKASATVRLSKVRGEDAVSMRKILESKEWREIKRVCFEVFQKAPAEFLAELVTRLEALDEQALGGKS